MWKTAGLSKKSKTVFFVILNIYVCAAVFAVMSFFEMSVPAIGYMKLFVLFPFLVAIAVIMRGRFFNMLFLIAVSYLLGPITTGLGRYIASSRFAGYGDSLLVESIFIIAISVVTTPPMLLITNRLYSNPDTQKSDLWKIMWCFPAYLFAFIIMTGNSYLLTDDHNNNFIFIRVFLYTLLLIICYALDYSQRQTAENVRLNENARMMEKMISMQQAQYTYMTESAETIKAARHDLKHHYSVMYGYLAENETARHKKYLEELMGSLPASEKTYCENYAVNMITARYLSLAESEGVTVETRLDIPEDTGSVPAKDLVLIIGNLLDNAVEACRRMKHGRKFITVRSYIEADSLSVGVTNSFDGNWRERNGAYISRKETAEADREGIGLQSIKALCEKHGGSMMTEAGTDVWKCSAIVYMD
jgi:hypothetical protein